MLGTALAANSAWLLLGMVPPLLYLELVVIPREEAALQREFGDAFSRYCEDTPRCVGVCIPCYASLCGWWEHHQYGGAGCQFWCRASLQLLCPH